MCIRDREINDITKIDMWFLDRIQALVEMEDLLRKRGTDPEILSKAKYMGFIDADIAKLAGVTPAQIKRIRMENGIVAAYKMVDTCAAEFEAATPYYYSLSLIHIFLLMN